MKKLFLTAVIALFVSNLFAQKDTDFYKHEIKASVSDAFLTSVFVTNDAFLYANFSVSYFYRPLKWLWVGGNFINYFGEKIYYTWREYDENGRFSDFSKSKMKYCAVIAPEIRFSYKNTKKTILYSALSGGIGLEDGYDRRYYKYPSMIWHAQITFFGFSCNFGKNNHIFLGGELGVGMKGFGNIHGGYRF